ncbi:MAG: hypothetical protein ACXWJK_06365 [Burkholderiaceae bacterium]
MPAPQRIWNIVSVVAILLLLFTIGANWLNHLDVFATTNPKTLAQIEINTTYVTGERLYSEVKDHDVFPKIESIKNVQSYYLITHIKSKQGFGKSILDVTIKCGPHVATGRDGITIAVSNTQLMQGVLVIQPISDRIGISEKIQCNAVKMHWK